jgi:protein-S-isoprenylcysteine O-methyltransferase Ste14
MLFKIIVFIAVVGIGWLTFWYVGAVYKKHGRLTLPAVVAETMVFAIHGTSSYYFLDWNGEGPGPSSAMLGIGAVLVAVGLVGTLSGMRHLGWGATFGQASGSDSDSSRPIRNTGVYRFTRNPQLIAYGLFLVGCALLWPNWWALAWLALYVIIAHFMVRTEERHLRELHGQQYESYCSEVPRWIGFGRGQQYFR